MEADDVTDLDKAYSDRLAILTVVATLGFEVDNIAQFRDWYDEFAVSIGNTTGDESLRERGKRAYGQFSAMVLAQIEKLRLEPNNSVLSRIIHDSQANLSTTLGVVVQRTLIPEWLIGDIDSDEVVVPVEGKEDFYIDSLIHF